MATTNNEVVAIAKAVAECGRLLKAAQYVAQQVLARNNVEAITWDSGEDAALSAAGLDYTGEEISNALGSLSQFKNYWTNAAVTQGDHGGNFEKLTTPIV